MDFTVKILTGEDVFVLIEDSAFIASWERLAHADKKVTVMQEPPFVIPWYKEYANIFEPVLCLAYDDKNNLVGLMPLAFARHGHYLTHAGNDKAEYHGWIAHQEIDQDFPLSSLITLKETFGLRKWHWQWMPPRAVIDWLSSSRLSKHNILVSYRKENAPLWDLSDQKKLHKILSNKSIRIKINRYRKRKGFSVERIKDVGRAKELIDIMGAQFDFRRVAICNGGSFERDVHRKNFLIERMKFAPNSHFTVLWADDKPVACHFGDCDQDTVYLGLLSYDPFESKNSPGTILLIELAGLLVREGYRYFDLTPGGDEFKERFANIHRDVVMPTFCFSKYDKAVVDILHAPRELVKRHLSWVLSGARRIKNAFTKLKIVVSALKTTPLRGILRKISGLVCQRQVWLYCEFSAEHGEPTIPANTGVSIQRYSDLLFYKDSSPYLTRMNLLQEAVRRVARGEILYSMMKDSTLVQYAWLIKGERSSRQKGSECKFASDNVCVFLYDFYISPQFSGGNQIAARMLCDSYKAGHKKACIVANGRNAPSKGAVESAGFKVLRQGKK